MAACEQCWADAYGRSLGNGKSQTENYHALLEERKDTPCKPVTVARSGEPGASHE